MREAEAVILSDSNSGMSIAAKLARENYRVTWYRRLEDLLEARAPETIPVLILHVHERPKGSLLGVIGRLAVECPGIQKVMVTDAPLSIEVAGFLTACDVDLVHTAPDKPIEGQLASVMSRIYERRDRCLSVC